MMDVPTPNQSQTPFQPWAGQNGWSTAAPPGPLCNPLPSFQHLSLGSPSDQTPCYNHLRGSNLHPQGDLTPFSSRSNTHHNMQYVHSADQSIHRIIPNVSSTIPAASQGKNIPPCSLPLRGSETTQPCNPQQMPLYSSHSPYQAVSPPFQPQYMHQGLLNGPQSPHQNHLPISPPLFGQCETQSPQCIPQPAFERTNVGTSGGYTHNLASPTSPIHQQPQWALPPHSRETVNEFIPNAPAQDRNVMPQSPNSESRYGLDPELLPSVVKVMTEDRAEWEGKVFVSEPFSRLPPLATTSCVVEDRGNASPFAIRSTSYCVPCEGQTALLSRLPLGALVTPLVKQNAGEVGF